MPQVIVSYDGTRAIATRLPSDDCLRMLVARFLAYVRHATEPDAQHEAAAQGDAEHLLAIGADLLGGEGAAQHVIVSSSTAEGLAALAAELSADVIAFGSSYRTPAGRVALPHTAEQLLDRGIACSLALAPAGLRRSSRSSEASGQSASMTRTTTKPPWRAQRASPMRLVPS